MTTPVRWGILGTGSIARQCARDLPHAGNATVVAVGSRTPENAATFARELSVARAHGSYAALAEDPEVEAIYIASPHSEHHRHALLCIDAGKAVLVEKAFTVNAGEAAEVIARAGARGVFAMEAMWTRFLPVIRQVATWLHDGAIGEARMLCADFGFRAEFDPQSRLFAPVLAGGALLDVGVYTLALAAMVFGRAPAEVRALAHLGSSEVDEQTGILARYDRGELAVLSCATRTATTHSARIDGTSGRIIIPDFWHASRATLERDGQPPLHIELPLEHGFRYELREASACIRAGRLESALMPLDETLATMRTMDALRKQLGVRYPNDG